MQESDEALLTAAAKAAGEIAMRHFGSKPRVWDKDEGAGPVTEADLEVNAYLEGFLKDARPDYGWLSEETDDTADRLETKRQFVVDPIDGTRAFIDGSKDWAHSIAIIEAGRSIAGVVFLPARSELYVASKGSGAFLNDVVIATGVQDELANATVLTTKPTMHAANWRGGVPPRFGKAFRSSLAFRMCLTASGRFDAMLTLRPAWEWDIAAGAIIVEEAGGTVTDRNGSRLKFNNSTPKLDGVVAGGPVAKSLRMALA